MENQYNLLLTDEAVDALKISSKWTLFLSILGFIGIAFLLLFGIYTSTIVSSMSAMMPEAGMMGGFTSYISLIYIVLAVVYFIPIYYIFQYSNKMKNAISTQNSILLSEALIALKSHHKALGIIAIVVISLYIIMFFGAIVLFASMGAGGM